MACFIALLFSCAHSLCKVTRSGMCDGYRYGCCMGRVEGAGTVKGMVKGAVPGGDTCVFADGDGVFCLYRGIGIERVLIRVVLRIV